MTITFQYPWPELEEILSLRGEACFRLLAYGSLMNPASAALTLSGEPLEERTPVVGRGIRRVFDYPMSPAGGSRYGPPPSERERAALNVELTGDPADQVNGILMQIPLYELDAFRQRERHYRLCEVEVAEFASGEAIPGPVYVLSYPDGDSTLLPHLAYLEVCREGATSVSAVFEQAFLDTTYLADRQTSLSVWLNSMS